MKLAYKDICEQNGTLGLGRQRSVNQTFRRILDMMFSHTQKYFMFSVDSQNGIFNNFYLDKAMKENKYRLKKISKYQAERLRNDQEINEWDNINIELNPTSDQY
jgi:hypothetical protein